MRAMHQDFAVWGLRAGIPLSLVKPRELSTPRPNSKHSNAVWNKYREIVSRSLQRVHASQGQYLSVGGSKAVQKVCSDLANIREQASYAISPEAKI